MRWIFLFIALFLGSSADARFLQGGKGGTGGSSALVQMQAINSGSTQTNVPFSIGVPFDVSVMDSSHHIVATDSTNGALACDETNRYSDIGGRNSGTPQVRGTTLSCVMPTWPAGTNNITLTVAAGASSSGTDISIADIAATSYDMTATVLTALGTTETASPLSALCTGAAPCGAGWTNASTPAVLGKWRSGGGIVTNYIVYVPFKSGGGTVDPLGLYALFDVSCYKAATVAVSGGNPVLSCHTDLLTGNSFAQHTNPLATSDNLLAYGISFSGQTSCTNWASSAPTQTLTFTNISFPVTISITNPAFLDITATANNEVLADNHIFFLTTTGSLPSHFAINTPYSLTGKDLNTPNHELLTASATIGGTSISTLGDTQSGSHTIWPMVTGTVTASSALWTSNSIGTVVSDGTFYGVITNVTSSTVADVSIWRPKPGLSTLTSGNYHLLPINHPYGARVHFACDWMAGSNPAPLRTQNGNLYLGNAWNGGAFTGGPGPYIRSTRLIPNYNLDVDPGLSAVASTTPACPPNNAPAGNCGGGQPNSQGNNPSAYGSTGTRAAQFVCNAGVSIGSFPPDQQSSGDNGQIYMNPGWVTSGTFIYDSNGYQAIFQNVDHLASVPWNTISNTSGAFPLSNAISYTWQQGSRAGLMTPMAQVGSWAFNNAIGYLNGCWANWPNGGHASNAFHVPYIMTGDWYILTHHLNMEMAMAGIWSGCFGLGTDNQWMGCHGGGNDERSLVWPLMMQAELVMFLPDSDTSTSTDAFKVLGGLTKTDGQTWLAAQWNSTGGGAKTYLCNVPPSFVACPGTKYSPGVYRTGAGTTGAGCPSGGTCNPFFTSFSTPDLRFLSDSPANFGFETGYGYNAFAAVHEMGMCDLDCQQTWLWYMQGQSSYITNTTDLGSPIAAALVEHLDTEFAPSNPCQWYGTTGTGVGAPTWACAYKGAYVDGYIGASGTGMARFPSGTLSLSGTTGTITATMPASGYIGAGTSFYSGGFLLTYDGGYCHNITVTNATHFTCDVVNTFGTTSYSNTSIAGGLSATSQWEIPQPAAGDSQGLEAAYLIANGQPGAGSFHFANIQYAGCLQANEYLGFPTTGTCNAIKAFATPNGSFQSQSDPLTFNIVPR